MPKLMKQLLRTVFTLEQRYLPKPTPGNTQIAMPTHAQLLKFFKSQAWNEQSNISPMHLIYWNRSWDGVRCCAHKLSQKAIVSTEMKLNRSLNGEFQAARSTKMNCFRHVFKPSRLQNLVPWLPKEKYRLKTSSYTQGPWRKFSLQLTTTWITTGMGVFMGTHSEHQMPITKWQSYHRSSLATLQCTCSVSAKKALPKHWTSIGKCLHVWKKKKKLSKVLLLKLRAKKMFLSLLEQTRFQMRQHSNFPLTFR